MNQLLHFGKYRNELLHCVFAVVHAYIFESSTYAYNYELKRSLMSQNSFSICILMYLKKEHSRPLHEFER